MTDILLSGQITFEMVEKVYTVLEEQTLDITICSPGGDLSAATAIIDLLRPIREADNLVTSVVGEASSAAVLVAACGCMRYVSKSARIGLHEPYLDGDLMEDPAAQWANERLRAEMARTYYDLLEEFTGQAAKWWRRRLEGKSFLWLPAEKAVEHHICDAIL